MSSGNVTIRKIKVGFDGNPLGLLEGLSRFPGPELIPSPVGGSWQWRAEVLVGIALVLRHDPPQKFLCATLTMNSERFRQSPAA